MMEFGFNWWAIPNLAGGLIILAVAVFVLGVAPGKGLNRRLAMLFGLQGFSMLALGMLFSAQDLPTAFAAQVIVFGCFMAGPVAYLFFIAKALDPSATRWLRSMAAQVSLLGLLLVAEAALILRPAFVVGVPYHPSYATWEFQTGPLFLPILSAIAVVAVLALGLALVTLHRTTRDSPRRRQAKLYLLAFGVSDAVIATSVLVIPFLDPETTVVKVYNLGLFAAAYVFTTLTIAYAILRYQLFGIDLRIKWTLRRGTVAAVIVACFLVGSQLLQNVSNARFGVVGGAVLAGLALFALRPIERMADRLADKAMPQVHDTPAYWSRRNRDLYLAAAESAIQDGHITDKERNVLATLADRLEISATEALTLERRAAGRTV